jgi:hypothetical protein
MNQGRNSETESEEEEEMVPQSETEKPKPLRNGNVRNQELPSIRNKPQQQQQQQQLAQFQPEHQPRPEQHHISERNEGYRTSVIRESRIKDRPVSKGADKSSLKIKIELDLEVEVDLYARVKGDITIGLM